MGGYSELVCEMITVNDDRGPGLVLVPAYRSIGV
jgi:hypothetical protein